MEDVVYSRELIESMPTGTFIQEQIQRLHEAVERLEGEREEMLEFLTEIVDLDLSADFAEFKGRIRDYIESRAYPTPSY